MIALLLACGGPPGDLSGAQEWTERWEILGITEGGDAVDVRYSVGDAGLLRGEGAVRLDRWSATEAPINYHRRMIPEGVSREPGEGGRLQIGSDSLERNPQGWVARIRSQEANATIHVLTAPHAPDQVVTLPVTVGRMDGWLEAGQRGGRLVGRALITDRPVRRALFVLHPELTLGVEERAGGVVAWGEVAGAALAAESVTWKETGRQVQISVEPAGLLISGRRRSPGGLTDPWTHLLGSERWLLRRMRGPVQRRVEVIAAEVTRGEQRWRARGLRLETSSETLSPPLPRQKAPREGHKADASEQP